MEKLNSSNQIDKEIKEGKKKQHNNINNKSKKNNLKLFYLSFSAYLKRNT